MALRSSGTVPSQITTPKLFLALQDDRHIMPGWSQWSRSIKRCTNNDWLIRIISQLILHSLQIWSASTRSHFGDHIKGSGFDIIIRQCLIFAFKPFFNRTSSSHIIRDQTINAEDKISDESYAESDLGLDTNKNTESNPILRTSSFPFRHFKTVSWIRRWSSYHAKLVTLIQITHNANWTVNGWHKQVSCWSLVCSRSNQPQQHTTLAIISSAWVWASTSGNGWSSHLIQSSIGHPGVTSSDINPNESDWADWWFRWVHRTWSWSRTEDQFLPSDHFSLELSKSESCYATDSETGITKPL